MSRLGLGTLLVLVAISFALAAPPSYVKKPGRVETIVASLEAAEVPAFKGKWYIIGPFDNAGGKGFDTEYPPEKEIDLKKTYKGKGGDVSWKPLDFQPGKMVNLKRFPKNDDACVYLFHEIDAPAAVTLPVSVGSDDGVAIWLNGEKVLENNVIRAAAPDQDQAALKLKPGKNTLLVKVTNGGGDWSFYLAPEFPASWPAQVRKQLERDFPPSAGAVSSDVAREAVHYKIVTLPVPQHIVLEVGGLAMRPDGKLLACTRRGDIWLISNPESDDPNAIKYKLFATGLHEALGLHIDGKDVYVVQRPELTKLVDRDGDDVVDDYVTICDKWGVSGDYHEFAFGPARDKDGNFFITLNVGFGWGDQAKVPWRGWCMKITPKGEMIPYATGLRSPNGVNFSPEGDLFYCDNQGEWVATNKMHHIREGANFGHQASYRWIKNSPFADKLKGPFPNGMLYDGQKGSKNVTGMPPHDPPCIWFPYGRMGQSASEPRWDTTGGKFGPFAGQCFVGDQTRSNIMRVALEKVNGQYQGACFPFRSGFQCGINRLVFGPDASLYAGQTNRGWGSVGGKPYGLQRLVYTGVLPFEMHTVKLTKTGFDVTFTKPFDTETAKKVGGYSVQSFTYNYWPNYGSPEVDRKAEKVQDVTVSDDGKKVSLAVGNLKRGRVYELRLEGIKSKDGDDVLHPEAYYTLNELP